MQAIASASPFLPQHQNISDGQPAARGSRWRGVIRSDLLGLVDFRNTYHHRLILSILSAEWKPTR